jgi:hypothetical protein
MGGLPGRAQPSDRQHLATAGILQQQRERRVHRHCGEEEAQHGTGLRDPVVAGDLGDARDQEPRRGDREDGGQCTLEERAGQHEQHEDREHDIEHPECGGSTRWVQGQDQRVGQPGGGEAQHQRSGDAVMGPEGEYPDDRLHNERGEQDQRDRPLVSRRQHAPLQRADQHIVDRDGEEPERQR